MTEPRRLADYVEPRLPEARVQAQWSRIAERQPQLVWPRLSWYAGGLMAAAAILLLIFGAVQHGRKQVLGDQQLLVERNATGQQSLTFAEGLSVVLQREARCRVVERSSNFVHLQLERGSAEFEVTKGLNRKVVVTAADFDVEVVGTRFEVSLLGESSKPDVAVRVQRGTVRVRPRGTGTAQEVIRTLSAGESWATRTDPAVLPEVASAAPELAAPELKEPAVAVSALPPPAPNAPSAKELFEMAESNRLKGRPREAAAALDRLRRTFPSDPRAGLASFELGRLRMDQLGDAAGALNAFADALRLDPSARFREDAQARLVQLYASLGQKDRCRKAQAEYQLRYPNGPHSRALASSCAQ